jgi:hypothetical protein
VWDFCAKQEFVHWSAVFTARFAALSFVKYATGVGEHPFDVLLSHSSATIALSRFQQNPGPVFGLWRRIARLMPRAIRAAALPNLFYTAAKCTAANKDDLEICLRALSQDCGITRSPAECAWEAERMADERAVVALIGASEEGALRDFEASPFSWY